MAIQLSTTLRTTRADAVTTAVGNAGYLRIYSGSIPANVAGAITGTMLSEHTLASPMAPGASSGVLTLSAIANVNASATGTATHFRIYKSDGTTAVLQGSVGTSGTDLTLNTVSIVSGGPVQITSAVFTEAGA